MAKHNSTFTHANKGATNRLTQIQDKHTTIDNQPSPVHLKHNHYDLGELAFKINKKNG